MLDVIIIGAGVSGLMQLHRSRQLGLSAQVFEAGSGVGGTWYWNRYPGARFDSESYTYGYSFSPELQQEWEWTEHFSAQPETLQYLNHVADRFDLRRDITFNTKVTSAHWDNSARCWTITLEDGQTATARFLIAAIGALSTPTMPDVEGIDNFAGPSFHTSLWPHEPVSFVGRRVGVVGTGATGVQVIQEIAKTVEHLTVFQRTPNWCAPLHNGPIDAATQQGIKARYPELIAQCCNTFGGFMHDADRRKALESSPEERAEFWEKLYGEPGFGIWMANYRDVLVDEAANALLSEFIAGKIRSRVHNPVIAEQLVPKDHGFGTRRVPMESGYFEVYNQPNVQLVDVKATPIERVDPTGIQTSAGHYDLDLIVYATGFDAVVGPFNRIDIRGVGGVSLRDTWSQGPLTYLGLQVAGFPNFFTLVGPHNAATFCNMPRCIEHNVEWVSGLLQSMADSGQTRVEASAGSQSEWVAEVAMFADRMLLSKVNSWFTGVNTNAPGRSERSVLLYMGGLPAFRERCEQVAQDGYAGFEFQ